MSQEKRTSSAVNSPKPLWNCTPSRSLKRHEWPSGSRFHSVASWGTYSPFVLAKPTRYS